MTSQQQQQQQQQRLDLEEPLLGGDNDRTATEHDSVVVVTNDGDKVDDVTVVNVNVVDETTAADDDDESPDRNGNNNNNDNDNDDNVNNDETTFHHNRTTTNVIMEHPFWNMTLFPDDYQIVLIWFVGGGGYYDDNNNNNDHHHHQNNYYRRRHRIVVMKLLKFIGFTWLGIILVHIVARTYLTSNDRDTELTLSNLWLYEGSNILSDTIVFFIIGRIYQQPTGVDNVIWICCSLLANIYFESQHYIWWLQHSATLYEMHCIWPWQLWIFVACLVPLFTFVFLLHVMELYRRQIMIQTLFEFFVCMGLFVVPSALSSPYFHFHHWFAGWVFGMHANIADKWWSRATMAYFWGMYINGIAIYGRDPLLTCDYVRFMVEDQHCHFGSSGAAAATATADVTDSEIIADDIMQDGGNDDITSSMILLILQRILFPFFVTDGDNNLMDDSKPADWRNCSSHGYHP